MPKRAEVPEGTQVVLRLTDDKFTSGHLVLPDGARIALFPKVWGNRKLAALTGAYTAARIRLHLALSRVRLPRFVGRIQRIFP